MPSEIMVVVPKKKCLECRSVDVWLFLSPNMSYWAPQRSPMAEKHTNTQKIELAVGIRQKNTSEFFQNNTYWKKYKAHEDGGWQTRCHRSWPNASLRWVFCTMQGTARELGAPNHFCLPQRLRNVAREVRWRQSICICSGRGMGNVSARWNGEAESGHRTGRVLVNSLRRLSSPHANRLDRPTQTITPPENMI